MQVNYECIILSECVILGDAKNFRGGSWNNYAAYCRSVKRDRLGVLFSLGCVGFRVAIGVTNASKS